MTLKDEIGSHGAGIRIDPWRVLGRLRAIKKGKKELKKYLKWRNRVSYSEKVTLED